MPLTFYTNKAMRHADRLSSYLKGEPFAPLTLDIDLTDKCNCLCPHCSGGRNDPAHSADFGDILRLMVAFRRIGGRSVVFTGGGEPTLHPDLPVFIHRAGTDIGLSTAVVTNGVLLEGRPDLVEAIVSHCSWIRISLDAGTPELYRETHGIDAFEKVLAGIGKLIECRLKHSGLLGDVDSVALGLKPPPQPTIGVAYLTSSETLEGIAPACARVKDTGADYLYLRPFLGDKTPVNIKEYQKRFNDTGFEVLGATAYEHTNGNGRGYDRCGFGWWVSVVKANGVMTWCCQHRQDQEYFLGDIKEKSLETILGRRLGVSVDLKECPALCRGDEMNRFLYQASRPIMHEEFL